MKKLKHICILVVIICFGLTGCVSDAQYEALEKRVTYLEEKLNIEEEEATVDNDDRDKSEANKKVILSSLSDFSYIIDDMSADEIVEECNYYFKNLPEQGQTYEDYLSMIKEDPIHSYYESGIEYSFAQGDYHHKDPDHDIILAITIKGTQTEMDGTIGIKDNGHIIVTVEMCIEDYERANSVYDGLLNSINECCKNVIDQRNGTQWIARGDVFGKDVTPLKMEREDCYRISVSYYSKASRTNDSYNGTTASSDVIGVARVLTSSLNVRSNAEQSSTRIGALTNGQVVDVVMVSDDGEWACIKLDGQYGYVMTKYVEITYY